MESTVDLFLSGLSRDVNETVLRNYFHKIGDIKKVKILDDKKSEKHKISYIGFETHEQAVAALKLAEKCKVFGDSIRASISKRFDGTEPIKPLAANTDLSKQSSHNGFEVTSPRSISNVGRGRGNPLKRQTFIPSFTPKSVILANVKLKANELIDVEIVDLTNLETICARPLKITENSKVEISDQLTKINAFPDNLRYVEEPKVGESYLGKWSDNMFYRVELIDIVNIGVYTVTFVDEGTYGDVINELRHIPEGPLQQYPKQFTKVTVGCKHSEELRSFIITESDGKKVSIFWLGDYLNKVPLINLFLGEEEVVEKFIQINKSHIRDSVVLKFTDMPIHRPETDGSNITFLQSTYKSLNDFMVQIREPMTILCSKKSPILLPVPGDICIYEKRNGVNNCTYLRCLVRRRQLFSFDILLFDSGENLNNVSIDYLYASEECHKNAPPFTISCELDRSLGYSEDTFQKIMCDENMKFSIVSYKGNNKYVVSVAIVKEEIGRYPEVVLKKFVGQSNKVIVTHVVSPVNFYIQIDRTEYVQTLNDIHEKLNINYRSARFPTLESVKIGQAVVAPFAVAGGVGENFRGIVLEKRLTSPNVHVYYIDYGNDGWVDSKDLMKVDQDTDIGNRPALALNCSLNIDITKEAWSHAIEMFSRLVGFDDDSNIDLVMQVMGEAGGKLIVDLVHLEKGSVSKVLERSGTCRMRPDSDVGVSPICNGNARLSTTTVANERPVVKAPLVAEVDNQEEDFCVLLKKLQDLEMRVAFLENRNYSR